MLYYDWIDVAATFFCAAAWAAAVICVLHSDCPGGEDE
jgi:hypothetical protein